MAKLLAISDGFRGKMTNVTRPILWPPKTVHRRVRTVPSQICRLVEKACAHSPLLPQIGLPEPPTKLTEDGKPSNIELGTPLDVETQLTLHLPPGTKVQTPAGTSVTRDYATYASKYSATADVLTASRQIKFLLSEVSAERTVEYNAFLHAVQNDQAQQIVLVPAAGSDNDTKH